MIIMERHTFTFKTNINCSGCVASVKPHLDRAGNIIEWTVDTSNKDKILTVEASSASAEEVADIVRKAGFKAEPL